MGEIFDKISVTEILEKVLEIAELNNDVNLIKWTHLELEGYFASNKYLTDDVVVPIYRAVPGEHIDNHNRPLIISNPKLNFINTIRLRESVPELESLYKNNDDMLIRKDPELIKMIKNSLGVSVTQFIINPSVLASLLNSIKQEAIDRSKKYISRGDLIANKLNTTERGKLANNTLGWLLSNLPLNLWVWFFSLLFTAFSFGLYISGVPQVKTILHHIPGYKVDIVLPPQTASHIEGQVTKLVEAHNLRISDLQKQLLEEEKLASGNIGYRPDHIEATKRIKETMREENTNFQDELKLLKDLCK